MGSEHGRQRASSGNARPRTNPAYAREDRAGGRHDREDEPEPLPQRNARAIPRHTTDTGQYYDDGSYDQRLRAYDSERDRSDSRSQQGHRYGTSMEVSRHTMPLTGRRTSIDHHVSPAYEDEPQPTESRHSSDRNPELSSSYRSRPVAVPGRGRIDEVDEEEFSRRDGSNRRRHQTYSQSPRYIDHLPQSYSASPRYNTEYPPSSKDRHGNPSRKGSDSQHERSRRGSRGQHPEHEFSRSPPSRGPRDSDLDHIVSKTAGLALAPADKKVDKQMNPTPRRGSSNSLLELARNNFEFRAIIITEQTDRYGESSWRHNAVFAVADTGCDEDMVLESTLDRIGIGGRYIEDIGQTLSFDGFNGVKHRVRKRVFLTWGKAKHDGRRTRRGYFLIVEDLPGSLEMVLGRKYMEKDIEKHTAARDPSPVVSRKQQKEDEDFEDWVVLGDVR